MLYDRDKCEKIVDKALTMIREERLCEGCRKKIGTYLFKARGDKMTFTFKMSQTGLFVDEHLYLTVYITYGEDNLFLKMPTTPVLTFGPDTKIKCFVSEVEHVWNLLEQIFKVTLHLEEE